MSQYDVSRGKLNCLDRQVQSFKPLKRLQVGLKYRYLFFFEDIDTRNVHFTQTHGTPLPLLTF
jgi:hypothetical protein